MAPATVDLRVKGTFQSRVHAASVFSAGTSRTTGEMTPPFAAESVEKPFVWCLGTLPKMYHLVLNAITHATHSNLHKSRTGGAKL